MTQKIFYRGLSFTIFNLREEIKVLKILFYPTFDVNYHFILTSLIRFPADFSYLVHNVSKKSISYNLDSCHKYFQKALLAMVLAGVKCS